MLKHKHYIQGKSHNYHVTCKISLALQCPQNTTWSSSLFVLLNFKPSFGIGEVGFDVFARFRMHSGFRDFLPSLYLDVSFIGLIYVL